MFFFQSEESYEPQLGDTVIESDQETDIQKEHIEDPAESSSQSSNQHQKRKIFISPKKVHGKKIQKEDPRIAEAYNVIKNIANKKSQQSEKDESAIFGEYVATQLRKFSAQTHSLVKHKINNILFEAEMGKYDQNRSHQYIQSSSSAQFQHYYQQFPSNISPAHYSQINQHMIHSPQSSNPSPKTVHYSISQQGSPQSAVQSSTPSPVHSLFTQQSPTTQEIQNELFSETESSLSPFQ